ncbi:MAG: thioredoxin family protein [Chitinophagaceae bacterium]|nr:thioredoxin family protein [Chitinophagaceae bacterium]
MKKIIPVFLLALLFSSLVSAQNQFQVLVERPGEKSLKGIISREVLEADSSFTSWYVANQKAYTPHSLALAALKQHGDSIQVIVVMGTWCEDSHFIIPKFFALTDAAGFSNKHITLIGTDRDKKTLGNLCESLNVKNVPTLIVMKEGKELGRVIEYGKTGLWDKELGLVINSGFTQ